MKKGLTLVEVLVALAVLAALGPIVGGFITYLQVNNRTELRSQAVTLAQERLEALRLVAPSSLPSSGCPNQAPHRQEITRAGRVFRVQTCYCTNANFCGAKARHIRVEVYLRDQSTPLYTVETVYTELE